ncbi:hypothetical protein CRV15_12250 [Streptomyces clavuligerus]|uniref:Uncharacterized protein n=1 Tax=Streptomyces clavuligerus TaxID=1901 RepID=B5GNZ4_STRCL|nr:hypothetical protein D1794_12815 [Streptomyces clavuligerus]EDY48040.1 hypothetical protein SSCG_01068 [Streptomyces clavuligerus]EFG08318.1 Hypothetical protein SCLAV_3247 [Streptomyces clavuligerus]QCS06333.1 hypothetical protein CRV15_12250 [Streptomyces clavuligerus]QPJ94311.1 hypothetical protein GE265_15735 [Streptomyces clavuligerus]
MWGPHPGDGVRTPHAFPGPDRCPRVRAAPAQTRVSPAADAGEPPDRRARDSAQRRVSPGTDMGGRRGPAGSGPGRAPGRGPVPGRSRTPREGPVLSKALALSLGEC